MSGPLTIKNHSMEGNGVAVTRELAVELDAETHARHQHGYKTIPYVICLYSSSMVGLVRSVTIEDRRKHMEDRHKPIEDCCKPTDDHCKPMEDRCKPTEDRHKPTKHH